MEDILKNPVVLDKFKSIVVKTSYAGPGQAGARKFKQFVPLIKYHNPQVKVTLSATREPRPASVEIETTSGSSLTFDTKELRAENILEKLKTIHQSA
eukprot:GILI01006792.1.p1 GENE.GILI01006792.1~~GILI01006792.1.p1  ORF type:complete len:108 (+),score=22.07 GILI01006792.1:36-326(+)